MTDQGLAAIAERVLCERLQPCYDLASAASPNPEQQKGIDDLWLRIGGSTGQFWAHGQAIAKAYGEGAGQGGDSTDGSV